MTHTFSNLAHLVGLPIMVILYLVRITLLLKRKMVEDEATPKWEEWPAIFWAYVSFFMPWSMESTKKKWYQYIEFSFFHLGILASIILSFVISYAPQILESSLRPILLVILAGALIAAVIRLIRRIIVPNMNVISTPDDYLSLIMSVLFVGFAIPAMYGLGSTVTIFFLVTFVFLVYAPISKIHHYIYFPFTLYYLGKFSGSRNISRS